MKKLFVFISCLFIWSCNSQLDNNCAEDWDYPVKPGMEEWKQFQTTEEMINAIQIPDNILFCLSTEKLTDLCLHSPLIFNAWAFNDLNQGLDQTFSELNGLRELFARKDAAKYLLKRYRANISSLSFLVDEDFEIEEDAFIWRYVVPGNLVHLELEIKKGALTTSTTLIDALLSRVEQQSDLKEILQNLVIGYEAISVLPTDISSVLRKFNFFARAHIIVKMCKQCIEEIPNGKINTVFNHHEPDSETADIINKLSYQLIK